MGFTFRPAIREQIRLLLSLGGGTGSGKTYSALKIAKGMVEELTRLGLATQKKFAVIDTENGRARMYADDFDFDVVDLSEPFRPDRYIEAIEAAEEQQYPVIVIDSASHEYSGDGGLLDWHEEQLAEMVERSIKGGDTREPWKIEDGHNMRAWIEPKMSHKKMVSRLLQLRAHVIFCLRAESKIEITKEKGKTVIKPKETLTGLDGWVPICEKNFPFEMTASFLLMAENPGVPRPIKLQEQHKSFFDVETTVDGKAKPGKPITEECGVKLAAWAAGGRKAVSAASVAQQTVSPPQSADRASEDNGNAKGKVVSGGESDPVKAFKEIETAPSLEALDKIGATLETRLAGDDVETAKKLFAARTRQLKSAAKTPAGWL